MGSWPHASHSKNQTLALCDFLLEKAMLLSYGCPSRVCLGNAVHWTLSQTGERQSIKVHDWIRLTRKTKPALRASDL